MTRVSWRPPNTRRLFGRFIRWTPEGLAQVRRGARMHYVDPSELTWEVN